MASPFEPLFDPSFRILSADGQNMFVSGDGEIFGTAGTQWVNLYGLYGSLILDNSFNQGGDVIGFPSAAENWEVAVSGSNAVITDGTSTVYVPVGLGDLYLSFDNVWYPLRFDPDEGAVLLGNQEVTDSFAPILADSIAYPGIGASLDIVGKLLFNPGGEVFIGGSFDIFGTASDERLILGTGNFVLDPSFNQGGDTVQLFRRPEETTAEIDGSFVVLETAVVEARIPVGPNPLTLFFRDNFYEEERELYLATDTGTVFIGNQIITTDPMPLSMG